MPKKSENFTLLNREFQLVNGGELSELLGKIFEENRVLTVKNLILICLDLLGLLVFNVIGLVSVPPFVFFSNTKARMLLHSIGVWHY